MNNNAWFKKENPLLSLHSMGGGAAGTLMQGAAEKFYIDDYFKWSLWQGNNTIGRDIVNNIDIADKGGMVWAKKRELEDHIIVDTLRGANNFLIVNDSDAQSTSNSISAFNSNGFTVDNNGYVNGNSSTYVGWTFAKKEKFFDCVTYTGNGVAGRTISHSLDSTPGFILVKRTDSAQDWAVYHRSVGATKVFYLNSTGTPVTDSEPWNDTEPTSSVFTVGTHAMVNASSATYVAYLFAHDAGGFGGTDKSVISCGGYTGNSNASGPTVTLGWEPQYLMIKRISGGGGGQWTIFDSGRGVHTGRNDEALYANNNDAETNYEYLEFNSTGFQLTTTSGDVNASADYVYIAIRRPDGYVGKPAESGTDVFNVVAGNSGGGTDTTAVYIPGFALDFALQRRVTTTFNMDAVSRLTGTGYLYTNTNGAEQSYNPYVWDYSDGWCNDSSANSNFYSWMWKRGQGFDVLAYEGNGSSGRQLTHNLAQVPEMIWCKNRSIVQSWHCYHKGLNGGTTPDNWFLKLNTTDNEGEQTSVWNDTAPTSTVVTVGSDTAVNNNGDDILMLLFSSVAGISKVGYYDGSTSEQTISTGFAPRFVIIKGTGNSEGWFVVDTVRGWASGNDQYIELNDTNAQAGYEFGAPTSSNSQKCVSPLS